MEKLLGNVLFNPEREYFDSLTDLLEAQFKGMTFPGRVSPHLEGKWENAVASYKISPTWATHQPMNEMVSCAPGEKGYLLVSALKICVESVSV